MQTGAKALCQALRMRQRKSRRRKALVTVAPLLCCSFLLSHAKANMQPDQGIAAIRHLDYQDFQEGADRIRVRTTSVLLMTPVGERWSTQAVASVDSVSGASPYVQATELRYLKDLRRAADLNLTHYGADHSTSVTLSHSNEADYLSRAISALYTRASTNRNLTLSIGLSAAQDTIRPVNRIVDVEEKKTQAALISASLVLSPNDVVQANLSRTTSRGYHSDPYKFADERPDRREADVVTLRWNHHFESTRSSLRLSQRLLRNDWGIRSQTFSAEYVLPFSDRVSIVPLARWYQQTAASFYVPASKSQFPFGPRPGQLYSEDQRLAAFGAVTLGAQLLVRLGAGWQMDIKIEQYEQRAEWRLHRSGTEGFVPFGARLFQIGLLKYL